MRVFIVCLLLSLLSVSTDAQVSRVWVADNGDGTYKNPIIDADYSDPDAIRVGDDYYLTASSFDAIPGLPILHSRDLVNWTIIGHALLRQPPYDHFSAAQHGNGVWAPAIRYHKGEYYIYYPDPDYGIYVTRAKTPSGPWSLPVLVEAGKGLIDPCPLWDDDGKVYLVHAYAGSRAGIKSILVVQELDAQGAAVTSPGRLVYDGHATDPTVEGPKFYKRNGYYYIFAPAGGVSTGWQLALRSKNVYGPYERKVVMDQGSSPINGPHQGAWVTTPSGESWFLHFQDKGAYGRVLHLQPMKWVDNWPVIGVDKDGDGKGEPVMRYKKPATGAAQPITTPQESDEFNSPDLGPQWQWQANPQPTWCLSSPAQGTLHLFSAKVPDTAKNLWDVPNLLLQKFPADVFMATTKLKLIPNPKLDEEKAGLVIMGMSYGYLAVESRSGALHLVYASCEKADKGSPEKTTDIASLPAGDVYLRVSVSPGAKYQFSYSLDGKNYLEAGPSLAAEPGRWIGAKVGLFCTRTSQTNDSGHAEVDWFRIEPPK
ncbi:MAG TPA: glycoside hydrolase 43 family protein [Puia sp.]|nr:glycoside hydrolase 43 family protein [Puia sp.]